MIASKIILFEGLDQLPSRGVLSEMKVDQCSELLFEIHLQWSIPSWLQRLYAGKGLVIGFISSSKATEGWHESLG